LASYEAFDGDESGAVVRGIGIVRWSCVGVWSSRRRREVLIITAMMLVITAMMLVVAGHIGHDVALLVGGLIECGMVYRNRREWFETTEKVAN
jgi:hypothetical protein